MTHGRNRPPIISRNLIALAAIDVTPFVIASATAKNNTTAGPSATSRGTPS